jgi:SNF2 family DNA or RNA helicase
MHSNITSDKIVKYYGVGRHEIDIKDEIIYVTSYSILSREFIGNEFIKKSIFNKIKFGRIVLDEAHYIRNTYSDVNKSAMCLGDLGVKKWVVTATPIFNSHDDMFAYFKFLGLEGVELKSDWNARISKSLDGFEKLNSWIDKY